LTADPPPEPYVDDDRPATLGDLRSLRRWLIVAAVWAVAATALGVIALIQANDAKNDTEGRTQSAADLARVQRDLAGRIDDLKSQVDGLPTSDDLQKLDGRIRDVEKKADGTGSSIDKLNGRVDDLEQRVDDLEQSSQTQTNTTTTP
jgi:polyhydroxyalkanoate synthesis regulator phasin